MRDGCTLFVASPAQSFTPIAQLTRAKLLPGEIE